MNRRSPRAFLFISVLLLISPPARPLLSQVSPAFPQSGLKIYNVKDFGASGTRSESSQKAIQKAVDACAAAGGGLVYVPPGEYLSGTIHLRSRVRFFIEAGATVFSAKDKSAFDKDALFYGDDLQNITVEGRGTIDGQAEYEWRLNDIRDDFILPNQLMMEKLGRPLLRSFPKKDQYGKLFLLLRCKDVRIAGLSLINSPSWTIHPYGCERMVIDGVYIACSLKEGVWADGIDPDGCKDLRISNCTIETGDDAIVFYSMNWFGPALPCENITITNCRLSSASSALKFCDGNMNCVRNVTVDNCVIRNSNRGLAFMVFDGGYVSDVVLSNLTIECDRHDWFWWGDGDPLHFNIKRRSEVHAGQEWKNEPGAGSIRNVLIKNVIARGKGSSVCNGHPQSWMDGITIESLKLFISHDTGAPYDKAIHALQFQQVKNLKLKDIEVVWDKPEYGRWESALYLEDIKGLELEGFSGRPANSQGGSAAAVALNRVEDAVIRNCRALPGTGHFLSFAGENTRDIVLFGNDFRRARAPYRLSEEVPRDAVREISSIK